MKFNKNEIFLFLDYENFSLGGLKFEKFELFFFEFDYDNLFFIVYFVSLIVEKILLKEVDSVFKSKIFSMF